MQRIENAVMATGLEKIAAKARSDTKLRFTSIAHHITKDRILASLRGIPNNTGRGVDRVDVETAKGTFEEWCPVMIDAIHKMGYEAPPVRRVYIPKPGKSEKRPIGVPTIADRALQKSVSDVLTQIYEADFLAYSFGGRPQKSAHQAVASVKEAISRRPVSWILEADLKNFFGSLDHGWAMRFVELRVGDPRILSLIRRWLKAGVMEEGEFATTETGTPQGGPISVLISNLYLHYVLDLWIEKVVKPRMKGRIYYYRYLDDFVICFENFQDANQVQQVLGKRLGKFGLELEPSKTKLFEFGRHIRMSGKPQETFAFLGFTFYCGLSKYGNFVVRFKTEKKRLHRSMKSIKARLLAIRHEPLRDQIKSINSFLIGHYRYYGVSSNAESLVRIYRFTYQNWRKALSSRSQNGYVNWIEYAKILSHFPIIQPKIYLSFQQMTEMAVL